MGTSNEVSEDDIPKQAALKIVSSIGEKLSSDSSIPAGTEPILTIITGLGLKNLLDSDSEVANETKSGLKVFGSDSRKHWLNQYPVDSVSVNAPDIAANACYTSCEDVPFFDFEDHLEGGVRTIHSRD